MGNTGYTHVQGLVDLLLSVYSLPRCSFFRAWDCVITRGLPFGIEFGISLRQMGELLVESGSG